MADKQSMHFKNTKELKAAGFDSYDINIWECTPAAWNALGGDYEKDIQDPFYNPKIKVESDTKLPF